jgi:hypothetical protein
MKDDAIVQKLDVARPKVHIQVDARARSDTLKALDSLALALAERITLLLGLTDREREKIAFNAIGTLGIDRYAVSCRLFTVPAATTVKSPIKRLQQIRSFLEHYVMNGQRTDDATLAAFERGTQTQQSDDIDRIHVKFYGTARGVIPICPATIDHVTQSIPLGTLRNDDAEACADRAEYGAELIR